MSSALVLTVYALTFAVGFPANVFTLAVLAAKRRHRPAAPGPRPCRTPLTAADVLLLNLTAADLLLLLVLPVKMAEAASGMAWPLPAALCPAVNFCFYSSMYLSSLFLAALGVLRYRGVASAPRPRHRRRPGRVLAVSAAIWLLACGHCSVVFVAEFTRGGDGGGEIGDHGGDPVDPMGNHGDPKIFNPVDPMANPINPMANPIDPKIFNPIDPMADPIDPKFFNPIDPKTFNPNDPKIFNPIDPMANPIEPIDPKTSNHINPRTSNPKIPKTPKTPKIPKSPKTFNPIDPIVNPIDPKTNPNLSKTPKSNPIDPKPNSIDPKIDPKLSKTPNPIDPIDPKPNPADPKTNPNLSKTPKPNPADPKIPKPNPIDHKPTPSPHRCYDDFSAAQLRFVLPLRLEFFFVLFLAPFSVTAFCYAGVARALLARPALPAAERRRAAGLAVASVAIFGLCFAPYNVSHAVGFWQGRSPGWRVYATLLSGLNAALDPLVFYCSCRAVRRALAGLGAGMARGMGIKR